MDNLKNIIEKIPKDEQNAFKKALKSFIGEEVKKEAEKIQIKQSEENEEVKKNKLRILELEVENDKLKGIYEALEEEKKKLDLSLQENEKKYKDSIRIRDEANYESQFKGLAFAHKIKKEAIPMFKAYVDQYKSFEDGNIKIQDGKNEPMSLENYFNKKIEENSYLKEAQNQKIGADKIERDDFKIKPATIKNNSLGILPMASEMGGE